MTIFYSLAFCIYNITVLVFADFGEHLLPCKELQEPVRDFLIFSCKPFLKQWHQFGTDNIHICVECLINRIR